MRKLYKISLATFAALIVIGVLLGSLSEKNDVDTNPENRRLRSKPKRSLTGTGHRETSRVLCPFNKESISVTEGECITKGCCWVSPKDLPNTPPTPGCFLPSLASHGYWIETEEMNSVGEVTINLKLMDTSLRLFPSTKERLRVHLFPYGDDMFRIKITDPNEERYEVPIPLNIPAVSSANTSKYAVSFRSKEAKDKQDVFAIQVRRRDTGTIVFDTSIGGFTFAHQFLQISTRLPSENLYGIGENSHYVFKHDLHYKTWPIFARDEGPKDGEINLYGSHPVYYVLEDNGNSHAVFWLNSNAMEAETLPDPGLTLRAIGGVFDLFFFLGPSPADAVSQYTSLIGRPFFPPYWSLGFQLCRYGHPDLHDMEAAMLRTRRHGIPQDVQYADIDYMDRRMVFTVDEKNFSGLPELVRRKKEEGIRFIVILDPAINAEAGHTYETHQRALANDVYVEWFNESFAPAENYGMGDVMFGYVWPDNRTAFQDFLNPRTHEWWKNETKMFYDKVKFDGLWIDMNEPANFGTNLAHPWNWPSEREPWSLICPSSSWDDPPYPTKASRILGSIRLSEKTICMVGVQGENREYLHYDVHNLYGWSQTLPTLQGLQNVTRKRGIVVSRSTFPSSGRWAGHWLGDNTARWEDLRASITGMLEFNLFGIPYIGADICGFFGDTTKELCARWMQLGAFYPYSRNHNSKGSIDHDPGKWTSVASSGRSALLLRYSLLPYLYTLHYFASAHGRTVVRPLFFEFPTDQIALSIDDQFLWGSSLMIAPIVYEGYSERAVYFPKSIWYAHPKGTIIEAQVGKWENVSAPLTDLPPLFIRGGSVLPTQRPSSNTKLSRKNPLGLVVAPDKFGYAEGSFFWDDGEAIDTLERNTSNYRAKFEYHNNTIHWLIENGNYNLTKKLVVSDIRVYSVLTNPNALLKNGRRLTVGDWHYDPYQKVLQIYDLSLPINENFTLSWTDDFDYKLPCPIPYKDGWTEAKHVSESMCLPGCIWNASENEQAQCQLAANSECGYRIWSGKTETENGYELLLKSSNCTSLFGDDVINVKFVVFFSSDTVLRFKFTDADAKRYEVPIHLNAPENGNITHSVYELSLVSELIGDPFAFYVTRKDTGTILFDTRIGGFVYSNQFISLSTTLASKNVYGFGENNHPSFRHSFVGKVWPIFSRDHPPVSDSEIEANLYGSHTFYQVLENDGYSHGVFLLNSNAIDYQMLDVPALTLRTIGGILDFFLFAGPTPEEVVKQYTNLIQRPVLPPYWALGFQICRWGYRNTDHIRDVLNRTRTYGIPQDVQYADIDYMDKYKDFTIDQQNFKSLPQLFTELRENGMRTIIILDPAINAELNAEKYGTHSRAMAADAYIKWPSTVPLHVRESNNPNSDIILGYVWPENKTAFPNWHKNETKDWWANEISRFYSHQLQFDGLWIDMNEPAVFGTNLDKPWNWPEGRDPWSLKCPSNIWDDPPYVTKAANIGPMHRMSDKTLCLVADEFPFRHYDSHNLYGLAQIIPTLRAVRRVTGERGLVISRSTFPSSGHWGGHWLGDNFSTWEDLRRSIIGMLEFNLFGIPYVGADICGFIGNSSEELCHRWMQLGAFYPFSRNHNGRVYLDQDPGMWPAVARASKKAMNTRYSLLPYLYTLFYEASTFGATVIRPLHHEFVKDRNTYTIDDQFLWGPALMISPVIEKEASTRKIYFPVDFWYDFYSGRPVEWPGEISTVRAGMDTIPLHIRGGYVLPQQLPALNTTHSRRNSFELLVTLNASRKASGTLFWDDGVGIGTVEHHRFDLLSFLFEEDVFNVTVNKMNANLLSSLSLSKLKFYGIEKKPSSITYNGLYFNETNVFYDNSVLKLIVSLDVIIGQNASWKLEGIWN